jgi:hypothetical protein
MYCKEIGWDGMDWTDLDHKGDQWHSPVNTLRSLQAP